MITARCLAALLIVSVAASPALADRPSAAASAPADTKRPGLPAPPSPGQPQGRALLLAQRPPRLQTVPLPQPVPQAPQALEQPRPVDRWWFWAAAGGLVLGTAALFLVATSGGDRPSTRLGNMEAFD